MKPPRYDTEQIEAFVRWMLCLEWGCSEVRVIAGMMSREQWYVRNERYNSQMSGWFDNAQALVSHLKRFSGVSAYLTTNPVSRDLLGRAYNRLVTARNSTLDDDVTRLLNFYADIDPVRKAGTSATGAELALALARRDLILAEHPEIVASSMWGASGNGGFLVIRTVGYPNDDASRALFARVNTALYILYSDAVVTLDRATKNPSRIMCVPGTMKCKGDEVEADDRVHRMTMIHSPLDKIPVPLDLEAWADRLDALILERGLALPPKVNTKKGGKARQAADPQAEIQPAPDAPKVHRAYALAALESELALIRSAKDGSRNTQFNNSCMCIGEFIAAGLLNREGAEDALIDAARECGLEDGEIAATLKSGMEHGLKSPRDMSGVGNNGHAGNGQIVHVGNGRAGGDGPAGGGDGEDDDDGRGRVVVTHREDQVVDQACAAIALEPSVYQRGNALVVVVRDAVKTKKFRRPAGLPRIVVAPLPHLRNLLVRCARWVIVRENRDGEEFDVDIHPPQWAVSGVATRGEYPLVRPIEGVTGTPVMRADGSVLEVQGYDYDTGLILESEVEFPQCKESPTLEDAKEAARTLLDVIIDFPFKGEDHEAAWLAALLTPLARFAFDGPAPLFMFDANAPGSGKSLLCDIIALVTTGRVMPRTTYPEADEEMRKRITSVALSGDRLMMLDNIVGAFGGSSLDAVLTATTWRDRILGKSELTPELPMSTVWFATGNNITLKGDSLRRVILARLETFEERPEDRTDFENPELINWIRSRRVSLAICALTILRAHHLAGQPKVIDGTLGTFEGWSDCVRQAVAWVTGRDPCATREELRMADADSTLRGALLAGWMTLPGGIDPGMTVTEALQAVKETVSGSLRDNPRYDPDKYRELYDALMQVSHNDQLPSARSLGMKLKHMKGRVIGNLFMDSHRVGPTQYWRVQATRIPTAVEVEDE